MEIPKYFFKKPILLGRDNDHINDLKTIIYKYKKLIDKAEKEIIEIEKLNKKHSKLELAIEKALEKDFIDAGHKIIYK